MEFRTDVSSAWRGRVIMVNYFGVKRSAFNKRDVCTFTCLVSCYFTFLSLTDLRSLRTLRAVVYR